MISKVRLLRGRSCGLVFMPDLVDAARELQLRGVVFNDRQADVWLADMARRGVIEPSKWVVETDRGAIAWEWDSVVRECLADVKRWAA